MHIRALHMGYLMLISLGIGAFFVNPVCGAEDPDELYRQRRFAEAETIYTRSDMDHPKDLRYRYNRGCASFQKGDYQGAMAAFSSVLRRATDRETRLKAAFNLGNTAFKRDDPASAAAYYRQVLRIDPGNEKARYNLEMAIRAMKNQKKTGQEQQKSNGEKGKQKNSKKEGGSKKNAEGESPSSGADSEKKEARENAPEEKEKGGDRPSGEEKRSDEREEGQGGQEPKTEETPPKDLSGDLKPLQEPPPEIDEEDGSGTSATRMDRQKAEALLDNVKEDRSRFLQLQARERTHRGVSSGKDW